MSKIKDKKIKRKRQLEARAKRSRTASMFFDNSKKFRTERYVPLMIAFESCIYAIDKTLDDAGQRPLSDTIVGSAYKDLILHLRAHGLVATLYAEAKGDKLDSITHIVRSLNSVAIENALTHGYTSEEILGVLRTLNSSRVVWTERGGQDDRGYIDFLKVEMDVIEHDLNLLSASPA